MSASPSFPEVFRGEGQSADGDDHQSGDDQCDPDQPWTAGLFVQQKGTPMDCRKRLELGIWSNAIRLRREHEELDYMQHGERHLCRVRYPPKPILENSAGLYLYDDRVAIHSAWKENYAMIVESGELSLLLKTVWNCIWEIAGEPC